MNTIIYRVNRKVLEYLYKVFWFFAHRNIHVIPQIMDYSGLLPLAEKMDEWTEHDHLISIFIGK